MVLSLPMVGPTLFDALIAEDAFRGSLLMLLNLGGHPGDDLLLWSTRASGSAQEPSGCISELTAVQTDSRIF